MKTVFAFLICTLFVSSIYGQQPRHTREEYISKSKRQNNAGWICLGTGAALIGAGFLIINSSPNDLSGVGQGIGGGLLVATGVIPVLVSVPLFMAGGNNKRKAARLVFFNEKTSYYNATSTPVKNFPAVGISINI